MLCPKCGYEMKPTDLDCPRCAKFAAEGTPIVASPAPAPPAGTSPANPIYVEDPYVHIMAKADVESTVAGVYFGIWLVSAMLSAIPGIAAFFAVAYLELAMGFTSVMLTIVALIVGLVVMYFVTKGIYGFIKKKVEQYALSSGKRE